MFKPYILIAFLGSLLALSGCKQNTPVTPNNIIGFVDCSYFAMRIEKEEFFQHTQCGTLDKSGLIQLNDETLALMDLERIEKHAQENLSPEYKAIHPPHLQCLPVRHSVESKSYFAYFLKTGKGRVMQTFDARCMPFTHGLTHTYINGRVAFLDSQLNIIQHTQYMFAQGLTVCTAPPRKYYEPGHYEHHKWIGGTCGVLDSNLNISIPIQYEIQNIPMKAK